MSAQSAEPEATSAPSAEATPANQAQDVSTGFRWLRWTLKVTVGLVILAGVVVLTGFLLPSVYAVEESVEIEAIPRDFRYDVGVLNRWPLWTAWSKEQDPDRFSELEFEYGQIGGAGAEMSWTDSKNGGGSLKILREDIANGIEYEMNLDGAESPRKGRIQYHRTGSGTKVTWKCSGVIGNNPINRWMHVLYLNDAIKNDLRIGLDNLKARGEKHAARRRRVAKKFTSKSAPTDEIGKFGSEFKSGEDFARHLLKNDADNDGKLSKKESSAELKWLFRMGDKNSDGFLQQDELKYLWRELKISRESAEFQRRPEPKRRRPPIEGTSRPRGIRKER